MKGALVCFEGIDGSGKSTLAETLVLHLRSEKRDAVLVTRQSTPIDRAAAERLSLLRQMLWDYPTSCRIRHLGDRHLIALMSSWFHLFDRCVIQPELRAGRIVITDLWTNKYIARFRLKKSFQAEPYFEGLTNPDLILFLKVSPSLALARKGTPKLTETGMSDIEYPNQSDAFIRYQQKVALELESLHKSNWLVIEASEAPGEIVQHIMNSQKMKNHLNLKMSFS
jgi:thymidylate kinase